MGIWAANSPWLFHCASSAGIPKLCCMAVTSIRSRILWLGSGIGFGAACFLAGRLSVPAPRSATEPGKPAPASTHPSATFTSGHVSLNPPAPGETTQRPSDRIDSVPAWDEKQWSQLVAQPGTPSRNAILAAMIEKLAALDPERALALAKAEGNLKLRDNLVQASLRGWACRSPTNAVAWALALPEGNERDAALGSVFAGAVAASPEEAVRLGRRLLEQYPDNAPGNGSRLVNALCDAGRFEAAAQLAASGDKTTRAVWLPGAYARWAEFQPEQAARAAAAISDPDLRNEALHGIVGGWAEADPAALVQFAATLPPETDRSSILSQAVQYWVKHDPEAASKWIVDREAKPEMDQGAAAVATLEWLKPEVALSWAESVSSPALRSETLAAVLRNWMTTDLPAARSYFEKTGDLLPEDRQQISESLAVLSGQPAGK
jgi:hypothetical protein